MTRGMFAVGTEADDIQVTVVLRPRIAKKLWVSISSSTTANTTLLNHHPPQHSTFIPTFVYFHDYNHHPHQNHLPLPLGSPPPLPSTSTTRATTSTTTAANTFPCWPVRGDKTRQVFLYSSTHKLSKGREFIFVRRNIKAYGIYIIAAPATCETNLPLHSP